ncbi:MAG: hypothetical protein K2J40_08665 [Ruminococcus sp.]|nr:hypothetical protein [Ruminococcus sp.]
MKYNFISSRKMAVINIIISCVTAIIFAILIDNNDARILFIAIVVSDIGFAFLSGFYWKQYDNGMPYNPYLSIKTAEFFDTSLKFVPLLVKYCVIAMIPTALYEDNYSDLSYIIIILIIVVLFLTETVIFFKSVKK